MDDIRIDRVIPRLSTNDSIEQVSGVVASVGPIMDTTNGKHVREVVLVDPVSFAKVKLLCYSDNSMQEFVPHMTVFIADARFRDDSVIVTANTTVSQLTLQQLPPNIVLECDAVLRPAATSITACTVGSVDITLCGVLTKVFLISLSFLHTSTHKPIILNY
jgi:hypothetical protein